MRRPFLPLYVLVVWLLIWPSTGCAQETDSLTAIEALNSGDYLQARSALASLLSDSLATSPEIVEGYFESYLNTGEYDEGIQEAASRIAANPNNAYLHHMHGRLLSVKGRWQEAEQAYIKSAEADNTYWRNVLSIGELLEDRGQRRQAFNAYAVIYRAYKNGDFRTSRDLRIAGQACAHLGQFHDANAAFNTAYRIDPKDTQNLLWWGRLFREKYNIEEAQRTLGEAVAINGSNAEILVEFAQAGKGFAAQEAIAQDALASNPNSVAALNILAGLRILDSQYADALELMDRALSINPSSTQSLAHKASVFHLQEKFTDRDQVIQQVTALNSSPGDFYLTMSKNAGHRFRYEDAVDFARKATQVDRDNWPAYAALGTGLLRLGKTEEARQNLDIAFDKDSFNLFVGNSLTLLDEYEDFGYLDSENFTLLIHGSEQDILGQQILEMAELCYDSLSARYPYRPTGKILIEAYNDEGDFGVRIAGVPHLGLLGVSFGDVVAIQTPEARAGQAYNWARTLWHEIAHTMAIGVSDHRVPRWFTEGLSVYEERRAKPAWGREMDLELYSALEQDKLLHLAKLDQGFTRPSFPGQVLLSYYHSSKIIGYIADTYGFDKIIAILENLKTGIGINQAIETALGESTGTLDNAFFQNLRLGQKQFESVLSGMPDLLNEAEGAQATLMEKLSTATDNPFLNLLSQAREQLASGDLPEAKASYMDALKMYPQYVGPGNPYLALAQIYRTNGETNQEIDILEDFLDISEHGAEESRRLGMLYEESNRMALAVGQLENSLQIEPYEASVYQKLAAIYTADGNHDKAAQANRALLALKPVDMAKAYLDLAQSLYDGGQIAEAKRATLQSLEVAPGFRDAQRLLLKTTNQ